MAEKIITKGIFCCDSFILDNTGKLSLIGIFQNMNFKKLPATYAKFTFTGLLTIENTKATIYDVKVTVKDPKGKVQAEFNLKGNLPENKGNVNVAIDIVNFTFKEYGTYVLELEINNSVVGSTTIEVQKNE